MAKTLEGKYYINGKDAYLEYGLVFEKGAFDSLLMFPETKPGYSEEYEDQTGTDYMAYPDTVVNSLSIDVPFLLLASNRADFMNKYNKIRDLFLPGKYFVIEVPTLSMAFTLRYSKMTSFKKVTQLKELEKVGAKLTMTLIDDKPDSRSIFKAAMDAARVAGYTVDEAMFQAAVSADLPYSYMKEAEIILAPGIKKSGMVAGVDRYGNIVEFTATRAGTATYIGKDGLLKTAAANEPRVDYSSGMARLLTEQSSSNLCLYSDALNNPYWTKTGNTTITPNAETGLDGAKSSSLVNIMDNSGNVLSFISPVTPGKYTFSFYIKPGTKISNYRFAILNSDDTSVSIVPDTDYSSQLVRGEFVRIQIPFTVPAGVTNCRLYIDKTNSIYGVSGNYYVEGVQLEPTVSATSLIPTNGAIAARVADVCKSVSNNIINYNVASLFVNFSSLSDSDWILSKNQFSSAAIYVYRNSGHPISFYDGVASSYVDTYTKGKVMSVYDASKKNIFVNGKSGNESNTTIANFILPGNLVIGGGSSGSNAIGVNIRSFAIFSRKFTSDEAINLTK